MSWKSFFVKEFSFFEVVSLITLTFLSANISFWWLLLYIPAILISVWVQTKYEL